MSEPTFLNNPNYREYVRLLVELHRLAMSGEGDSEEYDAITDQMDAPWYKLSPEEQERIKILSADLHMMEGDEVFRPVPPEERTREWLAPRLLSARQQNDWTTVLELLRNGPDYLPNDQLAYMRGRGYEELGHPEIALLFYQYAEQSNPQHILYSTMVMDTLSTLGQEEQALAYASRLLKNTSDLYATFQAARILLFSTRTIPEQEARVIYHEIITALEASLSQEHKFDPTLFDHFRSPAYLMLAMCYDRLEQKTKALEACNQALAIQPDNEAALTLRGLLQYASNPDAAATDFEGAVARNTPSVTPYLFLAHRYLVQGNSYQCLRFCTRALALTNRTSTQARVYMWMAIAHSYIGSEPSTIENFFNLAIAKDPSNHEIRANYRLYHESITAHIQPEKMPWPSISPPILEDLALPVPLFAQNVAA